MTIPYGDNGIEQHSTLSQIETSPYVEAKLEEWGIQEIASPNDLLNLRKHMYTSLQRLPYNEETKTAEKTIRWKRTGAQVLEDGYVYETKGCTDIVVAFLTLARAAGVENTRFVKVKNPETRTVHSIGEFELPDGWYIFDVSNSSAVPVKGEILKNEPFSVVGVPSSYFLWKKGRDSWDLGLTEFETIKKIQV